MSRPTFSSLKTFEIVARLGSLRAASELLNITPSAVSHQLRRLESSMGVELLEKQGRTIRLTLQGERLAKGLETGFAQLDKAVDTVMEEQDQERLRISCLPSIAIRWLIPRLNGFRELFPDYAISLHYIDVASSDIAMDVDIQVTWFDGEPRTQSEKVRLFDGDTLPVASPHYLQTINPIIDPADLLRSELLHDETREPWRRWFLRQGLTPARLDRGMIYQDFNLLSSAALAGQGVALCPPRLIQLELDQGTLEVLFSTRANTTRAYWLFYHSTPRLAVRQFIEWLVQEVDTSSLDIFRTTKQITKAV